MNRPIGILDSGLGGLTIYKEIIRELPNESIVSIGDSINTPYGGKTVEEIYQFSKRMVEFLLKQKVKLVVIACNTITVSCLDKLRNDYASIPLIGTVPVVKTAVAVTKNKKIGILSTTHTAQSTYQKELIKKFTDGCSIFNHGTDELVPLIEKGELHGKRIRERLQKILSVFQQEGIDTLALGCTHYPFLKKEINEILGEHVVFLDSGAAVARQVKHILTNNNILASANNPFYRVYTTGSKAVLKKVAKKLGMDTIGFTFDRVALDYLYD